VFHSSAGRRRGAVLARASALAVAALLVAGAVRANDSAAELDAGGLVLVRDADIALLSEDLRVGLDRIAVDYVFRNRAAQPKRVRVAFPLPAVDGATLSFSPLSLPFEDRANFVGFTVTVDGAEIRPDLEERAYLGEREVTEVLKRHRLPLNPLRRDELEKAVKALAPETRRALIADGLLPEADGPDGALWRLDAKFHWEQVFPPGRDLAVSHAYVPVKGFHLLDMREAGSREYRARYCLDEAGLRGVKRLSERMRTPDKLVYAAVVPYIVTTARNWAGRIGRFTLTVDKGRPETLVSFCRKGVTKTGPTTFRWEATDYAPDDDLRVLFLSADPAAVGIK
jgi:hypothetical protein